MNEKNKPKDSLASWGCLATIIVFMLWYFVALPIFDNININRHRNEESRETFTSAGLVNLTDRVLGQVNRDGVKRVQSVSVVPASKNLGRQVVIVFAADDNLTSRLRRFGVYNSIADLVNELHRKFPDLSKIKVCATFSLKDRYGDVKEDAIIRVNYTKPTLDRIHFDSLTGEKVVAAADSVWQHPALNQ